MYVVRLLLRHAAAGMLVAAAFVRERILPAKPRGYYRDYTVRAPGTKSRGARRIVCGGPPEVPEICYYTADHYQSFARIRD